MLKVSEMRLGRKHEDYEEPHRRDGFLLFVCFLVTSLVGYVLMNYVALLGT